MLFRVIYQCSDKDKKINLNEKKELNLRLLGFA
jgi:hypothetical protein